VQRLSIASATRQRPRGPECDSACRAGLHERENRKVPKNHPSRFRRHRLKDAGDLEQIGLIAYHEKTEGNEKIPLLQKIRDLRSCNHDTRHIENGLDSL